MVLTERQRRDLHAGIHEYLLSQSDEAFHRAAEALAAADPAACEGNSTATKASSTGSKATTTTTLLEKKWTAVSRLQKKVMEMEKLVAQSAKIHAHRPGAGGGKMLPRPPAVHTMNGHRGNIACVEVHPVFTVVVSGGEDGTVKVWDHESGQFMRTLRGHTNAVHSVSFTPDGSYLASSSSDLSIKLWDFSTYACVRTLRGHDHTVSSVKFIDNQNIVSASRDATVKFWEFDTGFCVHTNNDHIEWVRCLACKQDGSLVASSGNDTWINVCQTTGERKSICQLRGHQHVVESLSFVVHSQSSPPGQRNPVESVNDHLVSGSRDRSVRLWSISAANCLSTFNFHENWVRSVILHPSGMFILSSSDDRSIRVIDIKVRKRCSIFF